MAYSLSIKQVQDLLAEYGLIREVTFNGKLLYRLKDLAILEKEITDLSYFSKSAHEGTL